MLCGEKYHKVGAGKGAVHLLLVAHVADGGDVVEEMAVTNVDYAEIVALELREVVYNAGADEYAGFYHLFGQRLVDGVVIEAQVVYVTAHEVVIPVFKQPFSHFFGVLAVASGNGAEVELEQQPELLQFLIV